MSCGSNYGRGLTCPAKRLGLAGSGYNHPLGNAMNAIPSCGVSAHPVLHWTEGGAERSARWLSESGAPPAGRVVIADDRITADEAYGLACQGTVLLWRGDFHNARPMLQAVARPGEPPPRPAKKAAAYPPPPPAAQGFHVRRWT